MSGYRWILLVLALLVGLPPLTARADGAAPPWPMFQHDPQHTGQSPYAGPSHLALKWTFPVDGTPGSPAIGQEGTIYLPVGQPDDLHGYLYAINPNGTLRWRHEFPPQPGDPAGYVQDPGFTTPAIAPDGTIYVHTNSGGAPDGGYVIGGPTYLFAINPDGTQKWVYEMGSAFTASGISSPGIGPDGTVYVGSMNTAFFAINPNGTTKWVDVPPTESSIDTSPAIGPDGTVYVNIGGDLIAYSTDGARKWLTELPSASSSAPSPSVGADGTIYACGGYGACYAVRTDGSILWSFPVPGNGANWSPAVATTGAIYFTVDGHGLFSLNSNGAQRWRFHTKSMETQPAGSTILDSLGKSYVFGGSHEFGSGPLLAVSPRGTVISQVNRALGAAGSYEEYGPAIGANGTIYVQKGHGLAAYVNAKCKHAKKKRKHRAAEAKKKHKKKCKKRH